MRDKQTSPARMSEQTRAIHDAMRRAVGQALLAHKRAGNRVAAWKDGRVELVEAERIPVGAPAVKGSVKGKLK